MTTTLTTHFKDLIDLRDPDEEWNHMATQIAECLSMASQRKGLDNAEFVRLLNAIISILNLDRDAAREVMARQNAIEKVRNLDG